MANPCHKQLLSEFEKLIKEISFLGETDCSDYEETSYISIRRYIFQRLIKIVDSIIAHGIQLKFNDLDELVVIGSFDSATEERTTILNLEEMGKISDYLDIFGDIKREFSKGNYEINPKYKRPSVFLANFSNSGVRITPDAFA